jgi:protein-S-isoprenylcysteine O-methyltransferase Ste14
MRATALEFRLRYLTHAVIYLIGFTTPWNYWLHLDSIRTWQFLAAWPARSGWISFSAATILVLVVGIACALLAAALRTWASAYLGASIVQQGAMYGEAVVASGPYRHVRNPLYLGTFLHTFALALLMLPSGAIFTIIAIGLVQLRLIGGEEAFLATKLGAPYVAYCAQVPRLLPSLKAQTPASSTQAHWVTAFFGEIYMWGVVASFALLGWRYNSMLIIKGIVVSFGASLIVRAFIPKPQG